MGTCLSKKREPSSSSPVSGTKSVSPQSQTVTLSKPKLETESEVTLKKDNKKSLQEDDEGHVKKEIFIIKHRKSHDGSGHRNSKHPQPPDGFASEANVDAILLHCGRLSRNSSGKAASSGEHGRRRNYSGSKRSHDFDHCENDTTNATDHSCLLYEEDDDGAAGENRHHLRQHRHSRRSPGPCSDRRRRTPSRERDQQQRSTSRERRVSRSPSRRSSDTHTSNPTNSSNNNNNNNNNGTTTTRPIKIVTVPPAVSSLAMDKSNNGGGGIKRISVKRNVGGDNGSRSAPSPGSHSPARANGNAANSKVILFSENQQHPSLSRNSSRKAEKSPYRRNPLSELDPDSLANPQPTNHDSSRVQSRPKKEIEIEANQKTNIDTKDNTKNRTGSKKTKEQQEEEEVKEQSSMTENVVHKTTLTMMPTGSDSLKPPHTSLTRSRSSRRSRTDLDHLLNPETSVNPAQSYTSLLLEDIQNFHRKNNTYTPSIPLPACVTKACSILEAVADLNSTTNVALDVNHYGKRVADSSTKDTPFVESEVVVIDDVMEPSLHKYVTVTRGGGSLCGVVDMEDKESSGSNSLSVSGRKHLRFSSSWEPSSGDSTDRCSAQFLSQQLHPRRCI